MMQTGELNNVINELLGIQFNIEKARVDSKVQNLASYINENTLKSIHKKMDDRKENVRTLVKRMKSGSKTYSSLTVISAKYLEA